MGYLEILLIAGSDPDQRVFRHGRIRPGQGAGDARSISSPSRATGQPGSPARRSTGWTSTCRPRRSASRWPAWPSGRRCTTGSSRWSRAGSTRLHIPTTRIVVFGMSIGCRPGGRALSGDVPAHGAGRAGAQDPGDPRAQDPGAADRPAAGDPLLRLLAGDLAAEQGEQPDALGPRPGRAPTTSELAHSRRRAAADRRRERGRRPPLAQRADDDRERAQPGGEDRAAGDGPAAGHRLPEPLPPAGGQPADRPPGRVTRDSRSARTT